MSKIRASRLTGTALVVLGAGITALAFLFPGLLGTGQDNGLLVAPIVAAIGVAILWINRPTRGGRAARARRSA